MFLIEKDFADWLKTDSSRLYGFLVKRIYGRDNINEIVQRVYEYVLVHGGIFENSEKFTSYVIKCADSELKKFYWENVGFIKPTMKDQHPERAINLTTVKKGREITDEDMFELLLERYTSSSNCTTQIGKIEYEEFMKDKLKPKQFEVFRMRLYNCSYSEISKALGISETNVWGYIKRIKLIIEKLEN